MAFPTFNMPTRSLNKTLQFATRCRKRHFNITMNVLNLLLLGCCLSFILNPGYAQAKEVSNNNNNNNNNATLKSENILHVGGDDQMQLLNTNKKDKNNNNDDDQGVVAGTFKRLKPLDYKDLEQQLEEDIEKEQRDLLAKQVGEKAKGEDDDDDDERSSEIIEMIQPAQHTLRHQEHYKQRILMAAKEKTHFKENNNNKNNDRNDRVATIDIDNDDDEDDDTDEDYDLEENERTNQHNRNLRYQQIQLALREPTTTTTTTNIPPLVHHHRRHEHHFAKQKMTKQTEFLWPQQQQQHHLRHQHQHHHKQQQHTEPQELHHYSRKQNQTTNSKTLSKHQRYFDREISYAQPWMKLHSPTTEGPHLRHSNANTNRYWKSISNPHNRLFNDEQQFSSNDNQKTNSNPMANDDADDGGGDIKRITLSLQGHDTDDNKLKDLKENEQKSLVFNDNDPNNEQINKNQDYNDDLEDDYSYEDDDNDEDGKKIVNKSLKYPSIVSQEKTNVKRYTKPKTFTSSSYAYRSPTKNTHLRDSATIKTNLNIDSDDADNDYEEDDLNENLDDSSNGSDEDDDDKFTDEKWNKIEHEHYRKQLQHQRAMQALRARRPSANDNTPRININRYASYTPPAAAKSSPSSSYSAAWTKRQTVNEDDADNIYSRYYVTGSVTRKKEEELGSPAAVLESRRQFALQQRQNKALASAHHRRIVTEGSCRLPQPRVERVRRDSWKIYTPHCTILHRCADDGGCCPSERQTCAAKRTKNVDLYFFVISLNETQGTIEKLTFVNHTECHCVERSKQRAPEFGTSTAKDLLNNNQIPYLRRASIFNCNCPNLFEKILQEDGYCRCDCSSGNMGCDWLKRGMEHFSMNDRKCILEGRCKLPTCEYGQYIKKHGRCPRREERHLTSDVDW